MYSKADFLRRLTVAYGVRDAGDEGPQETFIVLIDLNHVNISPDDRDLFLTIASSLRDGGDKQRISSIIVILVEVSLIVEGSLDGNVVNIKRNK